MTRGLAPLLILAILGALALAVYQGVWWMTAPVSSPSAQPPPRIVRIPEGATLRQVAVLLEQAGLIRNRGSILTLGKIASADRRMLAGEYELHAAMRPAEILSRIQNGQVVLHAVTIPEGYTFLQIADLLRQKGLSDPDEFLRLARDKQFIQTLNLDVSTLEGYLFPNTYRFARNAKAKDVITTMVTGLWETFTPELRERAKEMNMTVHEVLTLASVIEKETSVDSERDLISAVFHNRLRRKIPLQSDPTVIYGLHSFDGNLKKRDLDVRSPYNTYRVRGLPPGPIASPGLDSIRAALYPIRAKYLYFVSRNDGTHHFSSTLDEHNRAVDKYQRRPARRRIVPRGKVSLPLLLTHHAGLQRYWSFASRHACLAGHPLLQDAMGPRLSRQTRHAMTRHALRATSNPTWARFTGQIADARSEGKSGLPSAERVIVMLPIYSSWYRQPRAMGAQELLNCTSR